DIQHELERRRPGTSRHVTQRQEADQVEVLSGVYEGQTTATPIALLSRNTDQPSKDYGSIRETSRPGHADYANWKKDGVRDLSGVYEAQTTGTPIALLIRNTDQRSKDYGNILETFRPGHADYAYWKKYGVRDPRGGGRSSARLTAPTVAAGAIAKKWLATQYG